MVDHGNVWILWEGVRQGIMRRCGTTGRCRIDRKMWDHGKEWDKIIGKM